MQPFDYILPGAVLLALIGVLFWNYQRLQIRLGELMLSLAACSFTAAFVIGLLRDTWLNSYPAMLAIIASVCACITFTGYLAGNSWCQRMHVTEPWPRLRLLLLGGGFISAPFAIYIGPLHAIFYRDAHGFYPAFQWSWLLTPLSLALFIYGIRVERRLRQMRAADPAAQ